MEYAEKNGHELVRLYADEGISGTKIKRRKEFQQMMADAERGLFQMLVVKDISRMARNTVDLLQSVRRLKALGIETVFLTANMTSMGDSEFVLTVFGALAEAIARNVGKGSLISIEGELRVETYENREGAKRTKAYVLAGKADFVSLKKPEGFAAPSPEETAAETPAIPVEEEYSDLESDTLPF